MTALGHRERTVREGGVTVDFSTFLDERQRPLLRLAIALCGSLTPAEDVLQDVLIRAYGQWERIGAMESPYGYVRAMVVNEHLAWRRRSARQIPSADIDLGSRPDHADAVGTRDDLVRRVQTLPDRQRTAIVLRYFGDFTDAEIAAVLDCAGVSVRSYISRGLATLRIDLAGADHAGLRIAGKDA